MRRRLPFLLLLALPGLAWAAGGGHSSFGDLLFTLALILGGAKVGGDLAQRLGQPAVLGELFVGMFLGNLPLLGFDGMAGVADDPVVGALAELGVIVLLFQVGLESTLGQMARVGTTAMAVAVLGVLAPMGLGYAVGHVMLPDHSPYVHLFLGATLTATSVGITARVLKDLGVSESPESKVILGAAVIDDVLGLIILASVSGIIQAANTGTPLSMAPVLVVVGKAMLFLGGAVGLGVLLTPILYRHAAKLRGGGILLGVSLSFAFVMSWLAAEVGLAPIVGAFAAGLILEGALYEPFLEKGERHLEELIEPVSHMLAPIFFVLMGFRVQLQELANPSAFGLAIALTIAAVVGKQACMLGVRGGGIRRVTVGVGMIPRGEVGLIFANIGLTLQVGGEGVISSSTFAAVVIMVMVTTLITPPALAWVIRRESEGPGHH